MGPSKLLTVLFLSAACGVPGAVLPPSDLEVSPPPTDLAQCLPPPEGQGDPMNCGCAGNVCPFRTVHGTAARICCLVQGCANPNVDDNACGGMCVDCRPAGKVCDRGSCVLPEDACKTYPDDDLACPAGLRNVAGCCS